MNKMNRTAMRIAKANSLDVVVTSEKVNEDNWKDVKYMSATEEDVDVVKAMEEERLVVMVNESVSDPRSNDWLWKEVNASYQHKRLANGVESINIPAVTPGLNGLEVSTKEFTGYVLRENYSLQLSSLREAFSSAFENEFGEEGFSLTHLKYAVVKQEGSSQPFSLLKLSYASVAQKRVGDCDGLVVDSVFNNQSTLDTVDFLNKVDFKLSSFAKVKGDKAVVPLDKTVTRVRLNGSSSYQLSVLDNFLPVIGIEEKEFKMYDKEGNIEIIKVPYYYGRDGRIIAVAPVDFTVFVRQSVKVSQFSNDGSIEFVETEQLMERAATDGSVFFDGGLMDEIEEELEVGRKLSAIQMRLHFVEKGLAHRVNKLRKDLGADIFLFDGSVKGDITPYMMGERGDFGLNVLNVNRKPELKEIGKLSRQGYTNIFKNKEVQEQILNASKSIWDDVFNYDIDAIKQVLGAEDDFDIQELMDVDDGVDNLTKRLFTPNPETFLKSDTLKKKLTDYLRSISRSFTNGNFVYLDDTSIRYLAVDIESIFEYMKEGYLGVHEDFVSKKGIKPERALMNKVLSEQSRGLADGESVLVRFPNLHKNEIRKVSMAYTEDDFYDGKVGLNRYMRAGAQHMFDGVIMFSLWDMNPEGMSGADFDGDTAMVIQDESVTSNFEQQPLFLDYSLVQNESGEYDFVDGCPFTSDLTPSIEEVLNQEELETASKYNFQLDSGWKASFDLEQLTDDNNELLSVIDSLMRANLMSTLKGNDIGVMTNVLATVTEAKMASKAQARTAWICGQQYSANGKTEKASDMEEVQEYFLSCVTGFEKLENLLAVGIRWEIDAAKHGGAYRERMPFINVLLNGLEGDAKTKVSYLEDLETKFNIALQPLFGNYTKG